MTGRYDVWFSRSAKRSLTSELPEKVAAAAYAFITGALADNLEGPLHTDPRDMHE